MNVIFLFFGATAELVGTRRTDVRLKSGVTANIAFDEIKKKFPNLDGLKLHCAVNEKYATGDEIIRDGDELAIFTAVSGG